MAKKKNHKNTIYIFPILFLTSPFIIFLISSTVRFIKTDIFDYLTNFTYFFDTLKNYSEYIFPTLVFFTIGLFYIVIIKIFNKKINFISWIFIELLGIIIIMCGNRFLFIITNNLWKNNIVEFLFNGINTYTFTFASELCFFTSSILFYFDNKYLKK